MMIDYLRLMKAMGIFALATLAVVSVAQLTIMWPTIMGAILLVLLMAWLIAFIYWMMTP